MADTSDISLNVDTFCGLKSSNCTELVPEHKLIIGLIKDSMLNVTHGHGTHFRDSMSFLANTNGELEFWLDYLPDIVALEVRKRVDTFLKQQGTD